MRNQWKHLLYNGELVESVELVDLNLKLHLRIKYQKKKYNLCINQMLKNIIQQNSELSEKYYLPTESYKKISLNLKKGHGFQVSEEALNFLISFAKPKKRGRKKTEVLENASLPQVENPKVKAPLTETAKSNNISDLFDFDAFCEGIDFNTLGSDIDTSSFEILAFNEIIFSNNGRKSPRLPKTKVVEQDQPEKPKLVLKIDAQLWQKFKK